MSQVLCVGVATVDNIVLVENYPLQIKESSHLIQLAQLVALQQRLQ